MPIALYRKYRPQTFAEVVSQDHVKTTLLNSVSLGKIGHAYIFVGARGIGKTTLARLFAKAVNCQNKTEAEPCGKCEACRSISENKALDLIEIDAASNRGIEEIRELREKVKFTPSRLKYKVFIIDEVHMLTKEAFNALLKTLEEPPEHAIFLLATTESHKVPATILSRCQRFDLKKLTVPELVKHLQEIASQEGVKVSQEALELISQQSDGCARDAISLFTQLVAYAKGEIDQTLVKEVLGVTDQIAVSDFVESLINKDRAAGIEQLRQLVEGGYDLEQFTKNLIEYYRKILLINAGADINDVILADLSSEQLQILQEHAKLLPIGRVVKLIKTFLVAQKDLGQSVYPQLPLELALVDYLGDEDIETTSAKKQAGNYIQKKEKHISIDKKESLSVQASEKKPEQTLAPQPKESKKQTTAGASGGEDLGKIKEKWSQVIEEVGPVNHSLAAFLRMGKLQKLEGEHLILAFKFRFHKERIAEHKYRQLVEEVMEKVYKEKILLKCVVDDKLSDADNLEVAAEKISNVEDAPEDVAEMAKSVFGGKLI